MIRYYVRTSRRTGVSFGWFGSLLVGLACLAILASAVWLMMVVFGVCLLIMLVDCVRAGIRHRRDKRAHEWSSTTIHRRNP